MTPHGLPVRERTIVLASLTLLTLLSWAYMWYLARDAMDLCMVNLKPWHLADLAALFAMWSAMMVAMMIPSASPMILAFAGVNRTRRAKSLPAVATGVFVLGYIAAWTAFSLAATIGQEALHVAALISPMGVSTSAVLGGVLLVATGVFQWTPLKNACLRHCRSPLGFILTEWRDGAGGALRMGLKHGGYCIGCCWLLMTLLFVAGVMNLWWVAAIAAFILIEKLAPAGPWVARITGVLLVAWGGWLLVRAIV